MENTIAMEEFKPTVCIVCFDVKNDKNCRVINETTKDVLDFLLLKRAIEVNSTAICNACLTQAFKAFRFKATCMDTENRVFPYLNPIRKIVPVNIKKIYKKESGRRRLRTSLKDKRICRLCLQIIMGEFTSVKDIEIDLIRIYIPEVNFKSIKEPVVCTECLDSLKVHSRFLKKCLDVQKLENVSESENMAVPFHIKTEEIEIKSEDGNENTDPLLLADESKMNESQGENSLRTQSFKAEEDKCDTRYHATVKDNLVSPRLRQEKLLELPTHKCDVCNYTTKHRGNLAIHELRHKDISDMRLYKCDTCIFETKHMKHFITHQLTNKCTGDSQVYKCDECNFETRYKRSIQMHQLLHKDRSQGQRDTYDAYDYKTKYMDKLAPRRLKPKSASEVRIYKCDKCDFETKRKEGLPRHQLIHKDVSEVQMYTCNTCSFQTKHKARLPIHQLKHKDVSEVRMYKCNTCSYETRLKEYLVSHQLRHKDSSQVQMYKCDTCNFESKHKGSVMRHKLVHKDVTEIQMYKCDKCSYETKRKGDLVKHRQTRKCF